MDLIGTAYANPEMDEVSVFGFCVAFVTVVVLMYRRELKTSLPLLGGLYAALSVYGFLADAWPVGLVLSVLAVAELSRPWRVAPTAVPTVAIEFESRSMPLRAPASGSRTRQSRGCESRLSRMFGS